MLAKVAVLTQNNLYKHQIPPASLLKNDGCILQDPQSSPDLEDLINKILYIPAWMKVRF